MTTAVGNNNPTLLDLAKATGPDGMALRVIEQISLRRPLLQDMVWREGNLTTGHQIARRTALPSPMWKKVNQGIKNTKGITDKIDESCGMLADKNEIDEDLVELNGGASYRAREDIAHFEGIYNQLETSMFYESAKTNPERMTGFMPRMDSLSTGDWKAQVIDAGLSPSGNDQASMLFVTWADDKVYGIFPKGTQAGMRHVDKGNILVPDENGDFYPAYVSVWKWRVGLCVEDARYVVRLCNIDTSQLQRTGKALIEAMIAAGHQLYGKGEGGRSAIYTNRLVHQYLHQQALDTSKTSTFKMSQPSGENEVVTFMGMPIRETDALLNTESVIS